MADEAMFEQESLSECSSTMDDHKYDAFVVHCNNSDDNEFVFKILAPWLRDEEKGWKIFLVDELAGGSEVLHGITTGIHQSRKTLIVLTEPSLQSHWCTFETIVAFEKAQRENQMSVILLLKGITKEKLPPNGVLHAAPSVDVTADSDGWKTDLLKYMKEEVQMPMLLQKGNIAHGLVWSHFTGFLDPILPELDGMIKESEIYKSNKSRFPSVLYELIPDDCDLTNPIVQGNNTKTQGIKYEGITSQKIKNRAGNERLYELNIYSVTDPANGEKYYFTAEHPSVLSTILYTEKQDTVSEETLKHNLSLHLARFSYTMQMVLDHPDLKKKWNGAKARLVHCNGDGKANIVDSLLKAIKEDIGIQTKKEETFLEENIPVSQRGNYEYDAYVCCCKKDYVEEKKIREYLIRNDVTVAVDETGKIAGDGALIRKSRWLIFPLSKQGMHDPEFTLASLSVIQEAVDRGNTLVIPIIIEEDREFGIPEVLRWVTYIQKMSNDEEDYLNKLLITIKGGPVPMDLKSYLPAGNVAYGLALGYVTNYLNLVLPDLLDVIGELQELPCQPYLFVLIPTSCLCKGSLEDNSDQLCQVTKEKARIVLYTSPAGREYSCDMYKIKTNSEEVYFLGLYAAPVNCLYNMIEIQVGGLKKDEMLKQRHELCTIINSFIHAEPGHVADRCKFVEFDDEKITAGEAVLGAVRKLSE